MTVTHNLREDTIPRLEEVPSYTEFLEQFLKPNRPVILGPKLIKDWPASKLWTRDTAEGKAINWDYLAKHYGSCEVSVSDCDTSDAFGNLECGSSTFGSVVEKWQRGEGQSLYAKDWHLPRTVESSREAVGNGQLKCTSEAADGGPSARFYTTPDLFQDDWMNAYYTVHTTDDFRFVYCGAQGTFTPLHRDVYCSYSWSTNVCGKKRWWMFPPEDSEFLFMKERRISVHDVRDVDAKRFPDFKKARPIVIEQAEGETIFVPSGWYHQVVNLTPCISINHNWCNSVNLPSLYTSMCDEVVRVEEALYDVRDMLVTSHKGKGDDWKAAWKREFTKVVQDVTQQDAGWNWLTFWKMVLHALHDAIAQEHPDVVKPSSLCLPEPQHPSAQPIFPPAAAGLHPSLYYIASRIRPCLNNFLARDRFEAEGAIAEVLTAVKDLLDKVSSDS